VVVVVQGLDVCPSRSVEAGEFGVILSPNYPDLYPNDLTCELTLTGIGNGRSLLFQINAIHLESGFSYRRCGCYDYITFIGSVNYTEMCDLDLILRKDWMIQPRMNGTITVIFRTDSFISERGFSITYAGMK